MNDKYEKFLNLKIYSDKQGFNKACIEYVMLRRKPDAYDIEEYKGIVYVIEKSTKKYACVFDSGYVYSNLLLGYHNETNFRYSNLGICNALKVDYFKVLDLLRVFASDIWFKIKSKEMDI